MQAVASFDVVGWDQTPHAEAGPNHSGAVVTKKFQGDLEAESVADLLMYQVEITEIAAGAGYVASERVEGRLNGRAGAFVMQHWGLSHAGSQDTGGHIVPGSGSGALVGLSGSVSISVAEDGSHTLTLDYDLDDDA